MKPVTERQRFFGEKQEQDIHFLVRLLQFNCSVCRDSVCFEVAPVPFAKDTWESSDCVQQEHLILNGLDAVLSLILYMMN